MFEQLREVEERYRELLDEMSSPAVAGDHAAFTRLNREAQRLRPIVEAYQGWRAQTSQCAQARELLRDEDPEVRELARMELDAIEADLPNRERELRVLMLPPDPLDEKNILLEIRAGTGGDESSLFSGDLFEMYARYAATRGWRVEVVSQSEGAAGGFRELVAMISGDRVYSTLKWESGVHRVQRVPATEMQGRIHTSTCTVAILPEVEEVDVHIDPNDLRIDTFRASGAGGQHVNKTDSAVRITHVPTGVVVSCQDEKSQHKNRDRAMQVLRSRLFDLEQQRQAAERSESRRAQVGTGDRSERIRTYNFPQNRLTDHRIGLTLYKLDRVMMGELQEMLDGLLTHFQAEQLAAHGL